MQTLALVLLVGMIGACLGSVANAFWGASGNGQGSGSMTTAAAVVVSAGTPTTTLYPGGHTGVALSVANPNPFAVRIGSLALNPGSGTAGFTVDAGHSGCAVAALSFATQTNSGAGWTIPAKVGAVNGSLSITLADSLTMDVGAANACQGAAFTVAVAAGP